MLRSHHFAERFDIWFAQVRGLCVSIWENNNRKIESDSLCTGGVLATKCTTVKFTSEFQTCTTNSYAWIVQCSNISRGKSIFCMNDNCWFPVFVIAIGTVEAIPSTLADIKHHSSREPFYCWKLGQTICLSVLNISRSQRTITQVHLVDLPYFETKFYKRENRGRLAHSREHESFRQRRGQIALFLDFMASSATAGISWHPWSIQVDFAAGFTSCRSSYPRTFQTLLGQRISLYPSLEYELYSSPEFIHTFVRNSISTSSSA